MLKMRGTPVFFCLVTLLCVKLCAGGLQTIYMEEWRNRVDLRVHSIPYLSSAILKTHSGPLSYPNDMDKTFTAFAPPGYGLLVSIRLIDLRPTNLDKLTIYSLNQDVSSMIFTNNNYFRDRRYDPKEKITFFTQKGQAGVRFTAGNSLLTYGCDGFEVVFTAIGNGTRCYHDDFRCYNGRCIAPELVCDDHNHCGDQSSMKNCNRYIGPGRNIGISIGCVFLIIAVACGIYIAVRKVRGSDTDTHTTIITNHPPPTTILPSYPPEYPQPGTYYPPPPPPYSQGIANPTYH